MENKFKLTDIFDGSWIPADMKYHDDGTPLILLMARKNISLFNKPFYNMEFSDSTEGLWVPLMEIDTKKISKPQPKGFIYHTGRSGSTIVCQMLTKIPGTLVLSEPAPIYKVLTPQSELPDDEIVARLIQAYKLTTASYLQRATQIIIKWPGWCCLYIDIIQQAFPDIPSVFIHRDPVEIVASVKKGVPRWLTANNVFLLTGLPYKETKKFTRIEVYLRAIGRYYQHIKAAVNRPLYIDYMKNPLVMAEHTVRKFNIFTNVKAIENMQERAKYHSNDYKMQSAYVDDSEHKRLSLSDFDRKLVAKLITPYKISSSGKSDMST